MQLKVGFAHESPNLNLFLLLTPADLFFPKSGEEKGERESRIHPGWLCLSPRRCVPPSLSLLQCDFWCEWKVVRDIWTVGFAGWWQ